MKRKLLIGLVLMFSGLITLKAQTITVSGNVKNSSGESLPGVTVLEKNSSNGRTTDMDGNYTIQVKQNATLVFSFIGYHPVEEMINNRKT
ncbi:MAG TPA: carboxypeptidase-like regulatory domain-containing protein, partial [Prolixibacteraceae bacterium]|nr:carboxypeptidase-like regulatory domain-containing protein [Prolixibacteraceae bacterium]